jgi:transposase
MAQASRVRRHHSSEFKQRVLAECDRPGASVAAVALSHGLNDNLVHKWRRQSQRGGAVQIRNDGFIPVEVTAGESVAAAPSVIEIDLRRGASAVQIRWPLAAAGECAAWLRGWLA